jgi:hypothetical protein
MFMAPVPPKTDRRPTPAPNFARYPGRPADEFRKWLSDDSLLPFQGQGKGIRRSSVKGSKTNANDGREQPEDRSTFHNVKAELRESLKAGGRSGLAACTVQYA